ncbi:hypothetical protein ZWY2020_059625 [Hordeum vulgare]|nr:hypothetical protein ZWY2020_059625 [Hordeum vulgare]
MLLKRSNNDGGSEYDFLGDRARSFADDLARYLPGVAGDARADLARLSDELLRLKVTAADVEHARRRPPAPPSPPPRPTLRYRVHSGKQASLGWP